VIRVMRSVRSCSRTVDYIELRSNFCKAAFSINTVSDGYFLPLLVYLQLIHEVEIDWG
jgi:hypothetical protein